MNISLEKIDALRERTQVNYSQAKEALEHAEGNLVDAIVYLEEKGLTGDKKEKKQNKKSEFKKNTKSFFKRMNEVNFDLMKDNKTVLRLPLIIFLIALLFTFPLMLMGLILAVVLGYKIEFTKDGKKMKDINDSINNISNQMHSTFKGDE